MNLCLCIPEVFVTYCAYIAWSVTVSYISDSLTRVNREWLYVATETIFRQGTWCLEQSACLISFLGCLSGRVMTRCETWEGRNRKTANYAAYWYGLSCFLLRGKLGQAYYLHLQADGDMVALRPNQEFNNNKHSRYKYISGPQVEPLM